MGRQRREPPAAGVPGWPHVRVADPVLDTVRHIAARLESAVEGRSIRSVATASGVTHQAVADLIAGRSWPEVATVVRLERALGVRLWPEGVDRDGIGLGGVEGSDEA